MRKSVWFLLCLVIFLLLSCVNGKKRVGIYSKEKVKPNAEKTFNLKQIICDPLKYQGKKVKIVGEYKGWVGEAKNPFITRSDWVINDGTAAIYVSGMSAGNLDPYEDIGTKVEVIGIVKIKDKIPYIEATYTCIK